MKIRVICFSFMLFATIQIYPQEETHLPVAITSIISEESSWAPDSKQLFKPQWIF